MVMEGSTLDEVIADGQRIADLEQAIRAIATVADDEANGVSSRMSQAIRDAVALLPSASEGDGGE